MNSRLVYSTEGGRTCPQCRQPVAACRCAAEQAARPRGDGRVRVSRETAGRGGKTVTLVRGLALTDGEIADLARGLRTACGTGGSAQDGVIVLQGDHVERVLAALLQAGHAAKRSGG